VRIELGDCEIREFRNDDAASLSRSANNERIADQLRDRFPHPYTLADAEAWIAQVGGQQPVSAFAIATPGEVIGGIGLELQRDLRLGAAEIGYWVAENHWGRGIATRAVAAFTTRAFSEFGLLRIYAKVFETNPTSARVLEKAGFVFQGRLRMSVVKKGRVLDQLLYSKLKPRSTGPS
jgi:ribosomal-protein-alanine N-acetyltransferase